MVSELSRHYGAEDAVFAKRFTGFQPMQSLDQDELDSIDPDENGSLLSDLHNAFRDLLHELRLEFFLSLYRNVDLVDREALRLVLAHLFRAR
jgi:hypothetical protein